jgi:hypothetical protein
MSNAVDLCKKLMGDGIFETVTIALAHHATQEFTDVWSAQKPASRFSIGCLFLATLHATYKLKTNTRKNASQ